VAVAAICPLALFRLLAWVDPGTPSGAALRQSWSDAGGLAGLAGGRSCGGSGSGSGSSSAAAVSDDGRSGGEATADGTTGSRMATAMAAFGTGVQIAASVAMRAGDLSADILGGAGVGSPGYSMTPADERALRAGSSDGGGESDGPSSPRPGPPDGWLDLVFAGEASLGTGFTLPGWARPAAATAPVLAVDGRRGCERRRRGSARRAPGYRARRCLVRRRQGLGHVRWWPQIFLVPCHSQQKRDSQLSAPGATREPADASCSRTSSRSTGPARGTRARTALRALAGSARSRMYATAGRPGLSPIGNTWNGKCKPHHRAKSTRTRGSEPRLGQDAAGGLRGADNDVTEQRQQGLGIRRPPQDAGMVASCGHPRAG
jgi:hypothetical protein